MGPLSIQEVELPLNRENSKTQSLESVMSLNLLDVEV
jgi:hypothetical protein